MASETDHIALANSNHAALIHLAKSVEQFSDWVTTIAFYKAVHVVEAVFAHDMGIHSTSHENRRASLRSARFKPIFLNYKHLDTASRIARYLEDGQGGSVAAFTQHLSPENVIRQIVKQRLYRLEQSSLPFLSESGRNQLIKVDLADF